MASLAPFKGQFQVAAGYNTKNAWGIKLLHTLITIKVCARADLSFQTAENQVFGAKLNTFRNYFLTEELCYHFEA